MAYLPPIGAPLADPLTFPLAGQAAPTAFPQLLPGLPNAESSYTSTLARLQPLLNRFPSDLVGAYQQYQLDRIARGAQPLGAVPSANALISAATNTEATPAPQPKTGLFNLPSNALSDLRTLVASVPRIPSQLYHAATSLPQLPGEVSTALAQPKPLEALSQVPFISLIPGAHTAGQVLSGDTRDLLQHPLFTALDVLPAARELGLGDVVGQSVVGQAANTAVDALKRTRPGVELASRFGGEARALSQLEYSWSQKMGEWSDPALRNTTTGPDIAQVARQANGILADYPDRIIPAERKTALTTRLQLNNTGDVLNDPSLTDAERSMLTRYQQVNDTFGDLKVQQAELARRVISGQSELLTPQQARSLDRYRAVGAWSNAVTSMRQVLSASLHAPTTTAMTEAGLPLTTLVRGPLTDAANLDDLWQTVKPAIAQVQDYIGKGTGKAQALDVARGFVHTVTANGKVLPASVTDALKARDLPAFTSALDDLTAPPDGPTFDVIRHGSGTALENVASRPPGAYTSMTDRWEPGTTSPHAGLGGTVAHATAAPRNPLEVQPGVDLHGYPEGAGTLAAQHLLGEQEYARLASLPLDRLETELHTRYGIDAAQLNGRVESMDALGAHLARAAGHDSIVYRAADPRFDEFVGLHPSVFQSRGGFSSLPDQAATPRELTAAQKWFGDTGKFTLSRAQAIQQRLSNYELTSKSVLPARYQPFAEEATRARVSDLLHERITDPQQLARAVQWATEGRFDTLVQQGALSVGDLKNLQTDVLGQLGQLRTNGFDPLFVHHVAPGAEGLIDYPHPSDYVPKPSSTKVRSLTFQSTPYNQDLTIALSHDAMEHVLREGTKGFLRDYLDTDPETRQFARPKAELDAQYEAAARTLAHTDPRYDVAGHLERLVRRDYAPVNLSQTVPADLRAELGIPSGVEDLGAEHPYVPRAVAKTFAQLQSPKSFGIFDPVTKAFRTALVPLSPRWFVHHTFGGAVMLQGQTGPGVWSRMGDASEVLRAVHDGTWEDLPDRLRPTDSFRSSFGSSTEPFQEWDWRAGHQLGQFWAQHTAGISDVTKATREQLNTLVNKSYQLGQFTSDMYRTMAYLYGYDKSLTRGMSQEAAQAAGEALGRRTIMTWDNMTPFERNMMRSVFPFYGFASHILQYAYHYPADHPFRAAVAASIARNEANDLRTGLPITTLSSFFLGNPDPTGKQRVLNLGSVNPFRDVASMTTLQGWLAATNPVISTALQAAGLDTASGGPVLFPNLRYDPDTGRLAASTGNPALNLLYNTIPQTQIVANLLSGSSEMKALARRDPAAAMRLLESQGGVPIVFSTTNPYQQQFKAEVARESAQSTALRNALTSGNDADAMRYPQLERVLPLLRQLQASGQLTKFSPNAGTLPPLSQSLATAQQGQPAALLGG